ncbi:hypothetical protein G9A89_002621 [Geosiphon pyriformis]|nr:hypothetical protein G9A89_002621 [Geosiphon pyriformis]
MSKKKTLKDAFYGSAGVGTIAHDLRTLLKKAGGKTCIINRSIKTGNKIYCAVVGFDFDDDLKSGKVCPWIANKFDGVYVFTSGMDFGYLDSGIAIIMDIFLAHYMCRISEMPDWLLSVKLLFKNKLSVLILGLYIGVSSVIWFFQAGNINFLIAKTTNKSFFVILGGNFNENGFHKCVNFRKCFGLELVNFLLESLIMKDPT